MDTPTSSSSNQGSNAPMDWSVEEERMWHNEVKAGFIQSRDEFHATKEEENEEDPEEDPEEDSQGSSKEEMEIKKAKWDAHEAWCKERYEEERRRRKKSPDCILLRTICHEGRLNCYYCEQPGHYEEDCPDFPQVEEYKPKCKDDSQRCYACGLYDHEEKDCPDLLQREEGEREELPPLKGPKRMWQEGMPTPRRMIITIGGPGPVMHMSARDVQHAMKRLSTMTPIPRKRARRTKT